MRPRAAYLGLLLAVLLLAAPAHAMNCGQWKRMGPSQKSASIDRMIQSAASGSGGRQYHVNRGATVRCLERNARSIEYDFDDACADARSAGMQALKRDLGAYMGCPRISHYDKSLGDLGPAGPVGGMDLVIVAAGLERPQERGACTS